MFLGRFFSLNLPDYLYRIFKAWVADLLAERTKTLKALYIEEGINYLNLLNTSPDTLAAYITDFNCAGDYTSYMNIPPKYLETTANGPLY